MGFPYMITGSTLTVYISGQPISVHRNSVVFDQVVEELNKPEPDADAVIEMASVVNTIQTEIESLATTSAANYLPKGTIKVDRYGVTLDGDSFEGVLADRLMDILSTGLRVTPWVRFVENLLMNPADYARDEMLEWLEKSDLPVTEDGHFLAYKIVRDDYTDVYSGMFDNSIGTLVQLEGRQSVDPDRNRTCSYGLHFCSKSYLPSFGANHSGRRIVLVKVNPADVVSIPADYDHSKGRTWRYEVVDEIDYEEVLGKSWAPVVDQYDHDEVEDVFDLAVEEDDFDYDQVEDDVENESDVWDEAYAWAHEAAQQFGIVDLRRKASRAGLHSRLAWKVYSKEQLADYIAHKAADTAVNGYKATGAHWS